MAVYAGNAGKDGSEEHGWLLGYFRPPDDLRHSADVEIKWGVHPRDDRRAAWATEETRTALLVLISGSFQLEFRKQSVLLENQGDYVIWGPGEDHSWFAPEPAVVLTVRWPSIPGWKLPLPLP